MFLFNQKKQTSLYKDFGHSEEVEKLLDYIETQYEEMLEKSNKKEIEYFDGLNRISEQVSSEFDLKIIELADLRLEYKFKDNLLFKFFVGAISLSIVELFFHPASKTFKNIFGYFSSIYQGEYNSIHHLVPFALALADITKIFKPRQIHGGEDLHDRFCALLAKDRNLTASEANFRDYHLAP